MEKATDSREGLIYDDDVLVSLNPDIDWDKLDELLSETADFEHLNVFPPCPRCGLPFGQWRGYRKTQKHGTRHRRKCTKCGRWFQQSHGGDEK